MDRVKSENLARLMAAAEAGTETTDAAPAVLYLEAAAVCNLRCPMCPTTRGLPRDPYRREFFDLGLLPRIEPILPAVSRAFLSGGGEPLLHPDFFIIVRALKRHRIEVHFNSNATLLDEARARELIAAEADTISFSIDGASAAVYQAVRVNADFERVTGNVARLAALKRKLGAARPYLNMQFTLLDLNRHEARAAVTLAARLGINHLVIEPLTPVYCFDAEYRRYYEAHRVAPEAVLDDLRAAAEEAARRGLVFSSHYLFTADHAAPERRCRQPWLTFGVRVDGRVFTCCGMIEPMGDLANQSFEEIWNGPAYLQLRRELAKGNFPKTCSLCVEENRANHFNEELFLG